MSQTARRWTIIILADFLVALLVLFISRYFLPLPRWYWIVGAAAVWVFIGAVSSKLNFGAYKRIRYVLFVIVVIDIISAFVIYSLILFILHKQFSWPYMIIPAVMMLLEFGLYFTVRKLVFRKIPFFYEEPVPEASSEPGYKDATKYDPSTGIVDLNYILDGIKKLKGEQAKEWVIEHKDEFSDSTALINSDDVKVFEPYFNNQKKLFIVLNSFGSIWHLNTFLANANKGLQNGGYIAGWCLTSGLKRQKIKESMPAAVCYLVIGLDYIWNRIFAKLKLTKKFYYFCTHGRNREFTRVEMLGRICMAGFQIADDDIRNGDFYITGKKIKEPIASKPNTGFIIRLKRVGKGGESFGVYKFRTMHSYSEYIQDYVYEHNSLDKGGKMADDFRITNWGHFMRKTWIDELPMFINLLKGNMKLVGVRPLSEHYFSLYTPEMQQLRTRTKPGLIPPFYAEKVMPVSIEDVQENERRYLEAYLEHPVHTDWRYFWGAMRNILIKGAKSK